MHGWITDLSPCVLHRRCTVRLQAATEPPAHLLGQVEQGTGLLLLPGNTSPAEEALDDPAQRPCVHGCSPGAAAAAQCAV